MFAREWLSEHYPVSSESKIYANTKRFVRENFFWVIFVVVQNDTQVVVPEWGNIYDAHPIAVRKQFANYEEYGSGEREREMEGVSGTVNFFSTFL